MQVEPGDHRLGRLCVLLVIPVLVGLTQESLGPLAHGEAAYLWERRNESPVRVVFAAHMSGGLGFWGAPAKPPGKTPEPHKSRLWLAPCQAS